MKEKSKGFGQNVRSKDKNLKNTESNIDSGFSIKSSTDIIDRSEFVGEIPFLKHIPVRRKTILINEETGEEITAFMLF